MKLDASTVCKRVQIPLLSIHVNLLIGMACHVIEYIRALLQDVSFFINEWGYHFFRQTWTTEKDFLSTITFLDVNYFLLYFQQDINRSPYYIAPYENLRYEISSM